MFQALEWAQRLERERLHHEELGIAQLIAVYVNSQKTKPPYYSAKDFVLFAPEAAATFPPEVANAFLSLSRDGKLPPWAIGVAPIEEIRKSANGEPPRYPRALSCRGLILIRPAIGLESVRAGLALVGEDCPAGAVMLWDVDSGEDLTVEVPEQLTESEVELRLI